MENVIHILKVRRLIIGRALYQSSWSSRLKIAAVALLFFVLTWQGVASLLEGLYQNLGPDRFAGVFWWIVILIATVVFIEGLISTVRQLYRSPESDLLLSLPVSRQEYFLEKWIERCLFNILLFLFSGILVVQYSRFVDLPLSVILLLLNVLFLVQQAQFLVAITYSRMVIQSASDVLLLMLTAIVLAATILFLANISPLSLRPFQALYSVILSLLLLSCTLALQSLFSASFHREYQIVQSVRGHKVHSYHRLFEERRRQIFDHTIMSEIFKDFILLVRSLPILNIILTVVTLVILSLVMGSQGAENTVTLFWLMGSFVVFIWTLYIFDFYKRQARQVWIGQTGPLTSMQIWWSRYAFTMLISAAICPLFVVPAVIGGMPVLTLIISLVTLGATAALLSFVAVGFLFVTAPYFRSAEYLYVIWISLVSTTAVVFPPILFLAIPAAYINYRKGLTRIEQLEL